MASPLLNLGLTSSTGGGLSDGDKGDIVVSGGGATLTIESDAVTYAKIQNVSATDKILGRSTAGAGNVEEITCTAAGRALLDDADAATQRSTLGLAAAGVLVTKSANQSIGPSSWTLVSWNTETYDDVSGHDNVTNNSRLVVPSGYARAKFTAKGSFAVSNVGSRYLTILKNTSGTHTLANVVGGSRNRAEADTTIHAETGWIPVTPGDYFEVFVFQDSGGSLNFAAVGDYCGPAFFAMELQR